MNNRREHARRVSSRWTARSRCWRSSRGAGRPGVSEIAGEIDVHKSTAFRLLGALEERGLVEQIRDRGKYRLGFGLIPLAGARLGHGSTSPGRAASVCARARRASSVRPSTSRCCRSTARRQRRPGPRPVDRDHAQLDRPAHPAALHVQRQGAARRRRPGRPRGAARPPPACTASPRTRRRPRPARRRARRTSRHWATPWPSRSTRSASTPSRRRCVDRSGEVVAAALGLRARLPLGRVPPRDAGRAAAGRHTGDQQADGLVHRLSAEGARRHGRRGDPRATIPRRSPFRVARATLPGDDPIGRA